MSTAGQDAILEGMTSAEIDTLNGVLRGMLERLRSLGATPPHDAG